MSLLARSKSSRSRSRRNLSQALRSQNAHSGWSVNALEPRLMLAGDAGAAVASATTTGDVAAEVGQANVACAVATTHQIVFLDSRVPDATSMASKIDPSADLVLIGPSDNAMDVIATAIRSSANVTSVHIISHGRDGALQLGDQMVDTATLQANANQIADWSQNLTTDADVLLYGCDVAASDIGLQFIHTLAKMTGADVAASNDKTGASERNGDWDLEESVGTIESHLALSTLAQSQYRGTLNIVINAWGQTGDEQFELQIDGQTVATYDAATTWTPFEYETDQALTGDRVRIQFTNDAFDPSNGYDRNLFVNNIQIDGQNYETNSDDTFSTGTWTAADGIQPGFGRGIVLHANGYLQYGQGQEPETTITVRARGDEGSEQFQILNDGAVLGTFTATTQFADYSVDVDTAVAPEDLRITFINDAYDPDNGIDRNLQVDRVSINDLVLEAEAPTTFVSGSYVPGQGIQSGFLETETLHSDGYFQFNAQTSGPNGVIDTNYGNNGLADSGGFQAESAIDDQGNTLVLNFRGNQLQLLNSSGAPVGSFGNNGAIALDSLFPAITNFETRSSLSDVVSTGDGGWLISTALDNGDDNYSPLIFKVDSSGALDASFGNGGVLQNVGLEPRLQNYGSIRLANLYIDAVVADVDSQGRILLAGGEVNGNSRVVKRFLSDGQIDTSFGNNGQTVLPQANHRFYSQQRSIHVLDDGSIMSIFRNGGETRSVFECVIKLTPNGQFDTSYGDGNGIASTTSLVGARTAVDSQGRVVIGGDLRVVRITASGQLDTSFGDNGSFATSERFDIGLERFGYYGGLASELNAIAIDENDRVIMAVSQQTQTGPNSYNEWGTMYLVLNTDGQLDTNFNEDGAAGVEIFPSNALLADLAGGVIAVGLEIDGFSLGDGLQYRLLI